MKAGMWREGVYCDLIKLPMAHPGDVRALEQLLDRGELQAEEIAGIIAQTEGDGYSRGYATLAFQVLLGERLGWSHQEVFDRIPMMMIGLTGGLMSPHYSVFVRRAGAVGPEGVKSPGDMPEAAAQLAKARVRVPKGDKRFVFGIASTRVLQAEEIGTTAQVDLVAAAVVAAIADAGITDLADVHGVEIKCPWGEGGTRAKAASALGAAVALQEVDRALVTNEAINGNHALYSMKASVSAGGEQVAARVIVMGNAAGSQSPLVAGSGVMKDALDLPGLLAAFEQVGLSPAPVLSDEERERVVNVFVNCGADALPVIRGRRHTMHTDALRMHSGIVAKAVANAVVGSVVGDSMLLCSAGSEHQGPQGANLIAIVARAAEVDATVADATAAEAESTADAIAMDAANGGEGDA